MSGSTDDVAAASKHQLEEPAAAAAPPPPPPPTQRRPRVREVRSRFMSPVISSTPSGGLHLPVAKSPLPKHDTETQSRHNQLQVRLTSAQRQHQLEPEPLSQADENRTNVARSLDTPFAGSAKSTTIMSAVSKRQLAPRSVKENGNPEAIPRISSRNIRPNTPILSTSMDRIGSSRMRPNPHHHHSLQLSISAGATAAVKLLQANGMSMSFSGPDMKARGDESSTQDSDSDADNNSEKNSKSLQLQVVRSSMPEADMAKRLLERNGNRNSSDSSRTSPSSRSFSSPRSSSEHPMRANERVVNSLFRQHPAAMNVGKVPLPPVPPSAKPGPDAKKGRTVLSHQEDAHTLRLLHNHYLQWRFANAKAEVCLQAHRKEAEKMLYSLSLTIADMYSSVKGKRAELETLRRISNVSAILKSQMPHLEEWSALEEDYLTSLSEAIRSLLNASFQLPIGANVRTDVREVKDSLDSAVKIMEAIALRVQSFTPKAKELEVLISELARVAGGERILTDECGDLLYKTHLSQVEECSLRGQIIQLQQQGPIHRNK